METNQFAIDFAKAISRVEKTNPELNNPGAIMDLPYYRATGGKFRLRQYPTPKDGWSDLYRLIRTIITKYRPTLLQFFGGQRDDQGTVRPNGYAGYAPAGHGKNNPLAYAGHIRRFLKPQYPNLDLGSDLRKIFLEFEPKW